MFFNVTFQKNHLDANAHFAVTFTQLDFETIRHRSGGLMDNNKGEIRVTEDIHVMHLGL